MPETLTFSVVNWKESDAECTFTVVNSGFGYTTQLQNKYYHTSFGLFILTNNTFFFDIYIYIYIYIYMQKKNKFLV